jgi:hypothetical protein
VPADDAVTAKCKELVLALTDGGIAAAKAKGWKPKPGASTHDQALDLLKTAVPLAIEELRADGLI